MVHPNLLLFLLLPVAALSGWVASRSTHHNKKSKQATQLSKEYFRGLNFLINEQPDKAVDVFIELLTVDSETVETHLALGSLFRRRGEVDRAIRIHQNLIARPQLTKDLRAQALLDLGQDYMRAGMFDRAEKLFLELYEMGKNKTVSLTSLLQIYQQQKDWLQAVAIAEKLTSVDENMYANIAHFYCELALKVQQPVMKLEHVEAVRSYLKRAHAVDKGCVRVSIMQAELYDFLGQHKTALRLLKRVKDQDPDFLSEVVNLLLNCYQQLGQLPEFWHYIEQCLTQYPRISLVLVLAEYLRSTQSDQAAINFIAEKSKDNPSLHGLSELVKLSLKTADETTRDNLLLLQALLNRLLVDKPNYRCVECGFAAKTLYWHCPGCRSWGSVKPIQGLEGGGSEKN